MTSTEQATVTASVLPQPSMDQILQLMVESAPIAMAVVDMDGTIVLTNGRLAETFGYEISEVIGQPVEQLIPERFRSGHRAYRQDFTENPRMRAMGSGLDLTGRRKNGSEFPIEVGLSFSRTETGLLVLASVVDISRRKQTEELLERRVRERTQELERRRQVSDSLRDILAVLNSNRPLSEILEYIVMQARRLLQADGSAIYQLGDTDSHLIVEASSGITPEQFDALQGMPLPTRFGRAVNGTRPYVMTPTVQSPSSTSELDYCAQLAVPLKAKDDVYGGLMLYYAEPRKFTPEEIELAVMFGDQAMLAIENARLRAQAERIAVAAERNRIARDLHDSVTQTLFSASLIAEVLPRLVRRKPDEGLRRLDELRELTRGALAEMRTLLLELRPATLVEVSMEELLRQLTEAVRGRARVPIELHVDVMSVLPPDVKVAFYYIAQEALNNVAKHAHASLVKVSLHSDSQGARLTVEDDGHGFDLEAVTPEHLGLAIMRERSEGISGTLEIETSVGTGSRVAVTWTNAEVQVPQ